MLWTVAVWCLLAFRAAGGHRLTVDNKAVIVELHNNFRAQVVPGAANMRRVHWNESLAAKAQAFITQCVWDHNPDLQDIGENLHATSGLFNLNNTMTKWYQEHQDYTYQNNSCVENKLCGHYIQVVWAETYSVGCAAHLCNEVQGLHYKNVTLLACNYFPRTNMIQKLPYVEGPPCSRCPATMPVCRKNLCGEAENWTPRQSSTSPPSSTAVTSPHPPRHLAVLQHSVTSQSTHADLMMSHAVFMALRFDDITRSFDDCSTGGSCLQRADRFTFGLNGRQRNIGGSEWFQQAAPQLATGWRCEPDGRNEPRRAEQHGGPGEREREAELRSSLRSRLTLLGCGSRAR
ncbi:peptidase inhibitor 16-like isoform X1 [Arapaima gigas]